MRNLENKLNESEFLAKTTSNINKCNRIRIKVLSQVFAYTYHYLTADDCKGECQECLNISKNILNRTNATNEIPKM